MPEFAYRAARKDGSIADGTLDAATQDAALVQLRRQGLLPVSIAEIQPRAKAGLAATGAAQGSKRLDFGRSQPFGAADVHNLTRELSVMLKAGLSLDRALRVLIDMATRPAVAELTEDLFRSVKSGKGFSQALAAHQEVFGEFYINMVRAGEAGGQLAQVLLRLAEHLERVKELREGVISALIYPAILVVIAALSVFLMLGFVVPQFESLFNDMGEALPLPTRFIVAAGHFVADWWWLILMACAAGGWGFRKWARTPAGRAWLDLRAVRLPVLGEILRKYEIARFSRSMGTLLGNGVAIVGAVRIASDTMVNRLLREAVTQVAPTIKQGGRMADALQKTGLFTPLALNMVRLGEETGRLDSMLLELARIYDAEVQAGTKRALTLIEPILILLLGAVIAAIIVSILLGILSVNDLAG